MGALLMTLIRFPVERRRAPTPVALPSGLSLAETLREAHKRRLADGVCQHGVNMNKRGCRKCEHGDEI